MYPAPPEEKAKPFRLVKYFTYSSLVVVFFGILVLSLLNMGLARDLQFEKSEEYAHVLVENLNHQIFTQFILPFVQRYGKIKLSQPEQFQRMDTIVRNTLHSFKVESVSIYDMNQTISYSFDPELIGMKGTGGAAYEKALKGESTSRLEQQGKFWELWFSSAKKSKIITVAPLRIEYPLFIMSGPVIGVVEIVQDVSEEYRAIFKFQIRAIVTITVVMGILFLALIIVVQRGEAIIRKRAQEAIRLREQLSRAAHLSSLGEMVAAISHEIRNPLGIIMSSAELLKKKVAQQNPSNAIPQIILEEATRLNHIITDFLNYARPREPHLVECRVDEILEKNIRFLASDNPKELYRIHQQADTVLPKIKADPDMLYQAFLNLLINARQAMPEGGDILIELSGDARWVKILFEDEGEGVPDEILDKIWNPFYTTKDSGTGLGLGIVKKIIESHQGKIRIENRPQKGARVTIELPIQPEV